MTLDLLTIIEMSLLHPAAAIFVIEGTGQQKLGNINWGDGFLTDENVIKQTGITDPNPFFKQLLSQPYRRQVIIGVHLYGPSISGVRTCPGKYFSFFTLINDLNVHSLAL